MSDEMLHEDNRKCKDDVLIAVRYIYVNLPYLMPFWTLFSHFVFSQYL